VSPAGVRVRPGAARTGHALLGRWWADPVAGLVTVPLIAREGWEAWRGRTCRAE
jgi:hypothetical protein